MDGEQRKHEQQQHRNEDELAVFGIGLRPSLYFMDTYVIAVCSICTQS